MALPILSPNAFINGEFRDEIRLALIYAQILYYYSILEFFHPIAIILMQVLLLCSYYAHFMIEKTPQN